MTMPSNLKLPTREINRRIRSVANSNRGDERGRPSIGLRNLLVSRFSRKKTRIVHNVHLRNDNGLAAFGLNALFVN